MKLRIYIMTLLLPAAALAHHGRDFLVTSSYKTPERGDFFAVLSSDYLRFNHEGVSGYEISPAILYGITDNWSVEFHSHHGIADGTVALEAVAVESMIRLFGGGHDGGGDGAPFSLAVLGEYGRGLNGTPDAAEGRLIIGKELGPVSAAANLIGEKQFDDDGHMDVRFAAGIRAVVVPSFGAGLELESAGEEGIGPLLTPGVSASLGSRFDLKLGASFDVEHQTLNAVRSQLIYEF